MNCEFAPVSYHFCFPRTLGSSGKRAQESVCASGDSAHSALVSLPPLPSLHKRSILEKFCIMMRSRQGNAEGACSVWRSGSPCCRELRSRWQISPCCLWLTATRCGWTQTPAIRKALYVRLLNQRVGPSSLALGCRSFSSIICLRPVRSEVSSTDIGLPWKGLVGLCLLLYRFGNT